MFNARLNMTHATSLFCSLYVSLMDFNAILRLLCVYDRRSAVKISTVHSGSFYAKIKPTDL